MKIGWVMAVSLYLWSSFVLAQQEVEIYTYDTLPPYAYRDEKGQLTGLYIELVRTILSRMPEYELKLTVLPWERAKHLAKTGEAFAILPPYFHAHDWLTDEVPSKPYIWPYSMPLYTQKDVVICNDNVKLKSVNQFPKDFAGLHFVMWRGDGRAGEAFNAMVKRKEITVHLVNSIEVVINLLVTARYDCTVSAALPFNWYFTKQSQSKDFKSLNLKFPLNNLSVVSTNQAYLGYSDINAEINYPYKKDFSIKFDIEIYKMKQSGELDEIVRRFVDANMVERALMP